MQAMLLTAVVMFGIIVTGLSFVFVTDGVEPPSNRVPRVAQKRPKGYWMGVGIAIGMLAGYSLSFVTGLLRGDMSSFIIFGPTVGMFLGIAIGVGLEQKHKDMLRPLTAAEQRLRIWALRSGMLMVGLGLLALAVIVLFSL